MLMICQEAHMIKRPTGIA